MIHALNISVRQKPSRKIPKVRSSSGGKVDFMIKRKGKYTIIFPEPPVISGYGSVAGKKESEGPLSGRFDKVFYDPRAGQKTFEQAESLFQQEAVALALSRAEKKAGDVDFIFAGDLLNQCVSSSYGMEIFNIPYLGQYGACSTMAQGLIMSAMTVAGGAADCSACVTSSHFCTAERQYRYPLEYGGQRTPTAQWTVTASGSCIVEKAAKGIKISAATVGRITDLNTSDPNNMGAAMAPAICIIEPYPNTQKRRLHLCFHDYFTKKEVFVTNCGGDHKADFSGKSYLNRRRRMSKKISAKNKRYYIQKDDYELPELTLPALEAIYGVWGTRYRHYLMRHDKVKYYTLLCSCVLHEHITEIDLRADRFYEETVNRLKKQKSVTEKLRISNPELWKKMMNKITDEATETVYREVIFKEE